MKRILCIIILAIAFAYTVETECAQTMQSQGNIDIGWYNFVFQRLGAFNGKGSRQGYDLAVYYFAVASAAGSAEAAYIVGYMYYEGLGVEPNFDLALEQFNLASERGNKSAAKMLNKINEEME